MSQFLKHLVRSEVKSCQGKVAYPREDSASRAAQSMEKKKGNGEIFEHYKCSFCDNWHIGHMTNFDWIPSSHRNHQLRIDKYRCDACVFEWYDKLVVANAIINKFPAIREMKASGIYCPSCKDGRMVDWIKQKWIDLETIPEDSIEDLKTLWRRNV